MYETILVPTDGSGHAARAFDHALSLAATTDATIHLLYVVDVRTVGGLTADMDPSRILDSLEKRGERAMSELKSRADARGVPVETAIRNGIPSETILEYADDVGADLLVMGTEGRTGVERLLLGSVTERVVRSADLPVLTVRAEE